METKTNKIKRFKKAVVDQILLWTIIFVSFVVILFTVVDYSMIMRTQGNIELMSQYGARMIAIDKTEGEIATELNGMRSSYFANIAGGDIVCTVTADGSYKTIFTITGLYIDTNILTARNNLTSTSAVFNESGSDRVSCTLTLTKQ